MKTIKTYSKHGAMPLCKGNTVIAIVFELKKINLLQGFLSLFLIGFLPVFLYGQQRPLYTQYIFNNYLLNPAVSGIENYIDLKAGTRQQWVGLEDAPKTSYISLHTPIGKQYNTGNATSFGDRGDNPMSRSYVRDYVAADPHHGIGFHVVSDRAGIFNRIDFNASYAYHLGLSPRLNLAVGVAAGIAQITIRQEQPKAGEIDDPAFTALQGNHLKPMLSAGVWFYGASFFVGLSAEQLLKQGIGTGGNQLSGFVPHYYATAGYKAPLGENIAILPSVLVAKVSTILQVDINTKIAYKDKFWIGGSYRHKDSFSALAGLNISYLFNLSYSYDLGISDVQQFNKGSHEIVLGLLLNNRYRVPCPQRQF